MKNLLTDNERKVMDIFWTNDQPLTSVDILEILKDEDWTQSYVIRLLNAMEAKKVISVIGTVRYRTQYARQFRAIITRPEYAARLAMTSGIDRSMAPAAALALAKDAYGDQLAEGLRDMIRLLEESCPQ